MTVSIRCQLLRLTLSALAALGLWAGLIGVIRAAEPPRVADFFRRPAYAHMVMSPNGKAVAATAAVGGRVGLVIVDLLDPSKSKSVASFNDADVLDVEWVNDDRLVFNVTDRRLLYGEQKGRGLFAVDRDGKDAVRTLIRRDWNVMTTGTHIVDRSLTPAHALSSVLRDGSNDVLIARYVYSGAREFQGTTLHRLDTLNGRLTNLAEGSPPHVMVWAQDAQGMPRALVTEWAGKEGLYWKPTADKPWTMVREFDAYGDDDSPYPILVTAENLLFFCGRSAGADTSALMRVDMRKTLAEAQTVLALDGFDFSGSLIHNGQGRVLGVNYLSDARSTHWFDPGLAQIQKQVDALLPGSTNLLNCGACDDTVRVLVKSSSDQLPVVFRVFDVKAGSLSDLASSRPWIKSVAMAQRDMLRITARDGLSFPVHVTRPVGVKGAAPMVVLVHGGPWVRGGEWRWDADSQFLASRGYVVVEPEFRGSAGFGDKLFRAGFKQWGLAMQDDIADATQWAIKQGYADAKRVCIAGASYGGYATLMGLIRYPELYRCGFEWVGVTDIDLMYSIQWSDFGEQWKGYGMPAMVGDRLKDAVQIAATSPLKLAAQLKQPLLMAYGGEDRRVPIDHGLKMRSALAGQNKNVEWIEYPGEGHGWMLEANDIDFWTRVEKFLDRNLKNAP
jgi:acetyl esterase/lipase